VIVPRFLTIILALVLGAPAASWGGTLLPDGVRYLGTVSCCGAKKHSAEPTPDSQIRRTCCCKPAPARDGVAGHQLFLEGHDGPVLPAVAAPRVSTAQPPLVAAVPTSLSQARAPPGSSTLLAQHTSLLL
jgi:hypothetical protein